MEYEKKYKEANDKVVARFGTNVAKEIFTDLYESEDEKIRKELIHYFTEGREYLSLCSIGKDDILAWLEKQGELANFLSKGLDNAHKRIDELIQKNNELCIKLEKQSGQKTVGKIEPKFHEGEWITNGDYTWKIVEIKPLDYILQSQYGNIVDDNISYVDEQFHSFTIEDAKDGDVLIDKSGSRECPFIFKETKPSYIKTDILNPLTVLGYCGIGGAGFTKGSGWGDTANCIYYPATKEQRDLLFHKMKEAGYEWDAEKKELKKVDAELTDFEKSLKHIMIETLECGDTHNLKADAEMLLRFTQKPAEWSKEDEIRIEQICDDLKCGFENFRSGKNVKGLHFEEIIKSNIDWLKSLRPQNKWKPSDEQMKSLQEVIDVGHFTSYPNAIETLYEQLKKLKGE